MDHIKDARRGRWRVLTLFLIPLLLALSVVGDSSAVEGRNTAKRVEWPGAKRGWRSKSTTASGAESTTTSSLPETTTAPTTIATTTALTTTRATTTTTALSTTVTTTSAPSTTQPTMTTTTLPRTSLNKCGLAGAVFCESFEGGAVVGGRDGDLSSARWSVGRVMGEVSASDLMAFPAVPVSACKAGVSSVVPDSDVLVCDAGSGHQGQMLTALGAQNYGLLSMRPRQQFDFGGRVGTVAYNVDAFNRGTGAWWTSVFVTDDPSAVASDSAQVLGYLPRNGVGVNFDDPCFTNDESKARMSVFAYRNYAETKLDTSGAGCVSTRRGFLNHIEVRLSQSTIEVWASDYSSDGVTFPNFRRVFSGAVSVPFARGYVHFQQAQRAPQKYGFSPGYANNYWSNLAFDGPVLAGETGYAVPDALSVNPNNGAMNVGYALLNNPPRAVKCCNGSDPIPVEFSVAGVDLAGLSRAELSFAVAYTYIGVASPTTVAMRYSLNGGPWRSADPAPNYQAERVCGGCPGPSGGGGVLFNFPVPLTDLRAGTNTIALASDNTDNAWPPVLTSLDLLTHR